eukprot:13965164-Ditylum_brightwellii.AAC.2
MIDPATSWFKITEIKTKRADVVSTAKETTWLTRYPYPAQVVLNRGTEFIAEFTEVMASDYEVKEKPITVRMLSLLYYQLLVGPEDPCYIIRENPIGI